MAEIIIVGAGLTGLSTAYYLEKQGIFDYLIFEQNDRPGGLMRSEKENGFIFDYTGHFLHCNNEDFHDFLSSVISFYSLDFTQRRASIYSHNVITDYPFQMNLHGLPLDIIVECIEKYVVRPKQIKQASSFQAWVLKNFGAGFGKHFFFPFNSKLFAYDARKTHPSWTGRFVPATNLKTIIHGALVKKPPSGIGYNSSFYYPKNGGIESVINQLVSTIKNHVRTNHKVIKIDTNSKRIFLEDGSSQRYRHIVSTIPLNQLLTLIAQTSSNHFHSVAQKLLCNAVININLGFSIEDIGPFHWLYFPEKNIPWYRLGFWHNICPNLAPKKHTSIYAEFSYLQGLKKATPTLKIDLATNKICNFLGISPNNITTQKVLTLDHAYVIYDTWRQKNISKLLSQLKEMDIHSIGRYGEWKYSSMQEAVLDGMKAAAYLHETTFAQQNVYPALRSAQPQPLRKQKTAQSLQ